MYIYYIGYKPTPLHVPPNTIYASALWLSLLKWEPWEVLIGHKITVHSCARNCDIMYLWLKMQNVWTQKVNLGPYVTYDLSWDPGPYETIV